MTLRLSAIVALISAACAFADSDLAPVQPGKRYAFTLHPVASLSVSGINVSFEGPLGDDRWAYEVPLYLGYNEYAGNNALLITGSGLGIRRYLIEGGAGTYLSPQIDLVNLHVTASDGTTSGTGNLLVLMPSLRLGYKARWEYFTLDTGIGFQFVKAFLTAGTSSDLSGDFDVDVSFLTPMFSFALGIPF